MALTHVAALVGGVGGAKLAFGLAKLLDPGQLSCIINTGDDFSLYGLEISPDIDTVMYTLSGLANPQTGWGLAGDTTQMLEMMQRYGHEAWFQLRDRDLATHLLRTEWLREGQTLTEVTARLAAALGVAHPLLPMTDSLLRTRVNTVEHGWLEFQEYFVRYRWQPTVTELRYHGADQAVLPSGVKNALERADAVVICPSNPLLSIDPILAVPGLRGMLAEKPTVAVTPIIEGGAVKGPAAKLMAELGWPVSPVSVAAHYADFLNGFIADVRDGTQVAQADFGCPLLVVDTMMRTDQDRVRLAGEVLGWVEEIIS